MYRPEINAYVKPLLQETPKINFSVLGKGYNRTIKATRRFNLNPYDDVGAWTNFSLPYPMHDYGSFEDEYLCKFKTVDKRPKIIFSKSRKCGLTYNIPSGDEHVFRITPKEHMDKILDDYNETSESPWDTYSKDLWIGENLAKQIAVPNLVLDIDELEHIAENKSALRVLDIYGDVFGKPKNKPIINFKYN